MPALLFAPAARADEPEARTPTPIDRLGANVLDAFSGTNLLYYGGAIAVTGVMAYGGADQAVRLWTQRDWPISAYGDVSYYAGYLAPVVIAPGLYLAGLALRDRTLAGAGAAATQALVVTVLATGALKAVTGRPYPTHGGDPNDPARLTHPEYAREFAPLGFAGRYAWPSGHTSSTVTLAASLSAYYPEQRWMPFALYPIALGIGVGMIDGDRHWTSDVIAGALIGQAIGWSIGRDFRHLVREPSEPTSAWQRLSIRPLAGATYGLAIAGEL